MSDRANTITVVLDKPMRHDDLEQLLTAIKQLRGVETAAPDVADPVSYMAQARVRQELGSKLWKVLYPETEEV